MRLLSPSFHLGRFLIPWILFSLSCAFPVPRHPPHSHLHRTHTTITSQHKLKEDPDVPDFWYKILAIVLLVLLGGLFAGLTLGLLSLDLISLEVLSQSGNAKEQRYATLIKPIRAKGHWLLVTLLLANVIVNETLPILADSIWGGGWPAIVLSTTLIVIFGEVIPQAVCSRYGLAIGANLSWLVRFMMFIMSPIAWPIARMLDWALGETQGTTYRRAGLKALVSLHGNRPESSQSHAHVRTESIERLTEDEVTIIKAALDLREKTVGQIMTPLDDVFMVNWDQVLDYKVMHFILEKGYSRIPIYAGFSRRNIVGMLLVKKLITYDPHDALKVKEFTQAIQSIPVIDPDFKCLDLINIFQEGKSI
ncbi:hypothetical protein BKA69DRAFT_1032612 [Paraphysoderma sedebokerense]|nr:hypothetical protein BKA69DRAFT_1032612 [Paraphysoderma sedebokerense]